ncbi:pectin acetylesterase-family hydrolase [Leptospira wolffii]|uniref:Pectin acetylesterase-family hydrolase n=1 Tax=Leptospira wolffii TaxID=409998 RepID=A0ABV5BS11_9LEPT|nr:pectin acetylesterase-family hydrolase [Leptospira wolffii]EPG66423.1 pectinacetylesterase domain protein [Leptospira wolffii serovar Khorat str. Khorat-H2]TGL50571.1 pectin acetylesterase [Leptospira wolffii]
MNQVKRIGLRELLITLVVITWNCSQSGKAADGQDLALLSGLLEPSQAEAANLPSSSSGDVQAQNVLDDLTSVVYGSYDVIYIPGAVCGNGTPYKIFVDRADGLLDWILGNSSRLLVYLEPGGACWDYASCTGQTGIRGAANPNGIPDNHMNFGDFIDPNKPGGSPNAAISPIILKNHPTGQNVKTSSWNKVFIPYCTGDVYSGNKVATYSDPTGQNPPITYRHVGAKNMELVIDWLKSNFNKPKELFVSGCSAGGTGSLTNYHFIRKALSPSKSYLLNDSGPIFPAPGYGNQWPLQQKIREAWNTDYFVNKAQADFPSVDIRSDYGKISEALAQKYPNDKLAITLFRRDANYSMYSYARFYGLDENIPADKEYIISTLWAQDIENLKAQYDRYPNLEYFIPYYRSINESHCTSIVEFTGTEIGNTGITLGTFINDYIFGSSGFRSFFEDVNPNDANVTDFWFALVNLLL